MKSKIKIGKTITRLIKYIVSTHRHQFLLVCLAIIISALANMAGPLFIMYLIDDIVTPLMKQQSPDFTAMWIAVGVMAAFYFLGVICTYIYNRLMVNIGQGVQKRIRNEMFEKMQKLPLKFFDTHAHGELMSVYTNDIDTLRQLISQSIPQIFSSFVTIVAIFTVMVIVSWQLSIIAVTMVFLMLIVSKYLGKKSSKYFIAQQDELSATNGFIEEIMSGQKVVKVFNYEQQAEDRFVVLNESLKTSATKANHYANVVMPSIANIGNLQYVITAIIGGVMLINGVGVLTLGKLVSYMQFTRSFNMPFSQISQQFNSMAMALAGAKRIFSLMDEVPETDSGLATLVNIPDNKKGNTVETTAKTSKWAWKITSAQATINYTKLQGHVVFNNVTFGYNQERPILKNISLQAVAGQKIAFVGSTGAGKTTITNLINRFYDVSEGQIIYDNIDINDIKKADLRRSLGIVLQDTVLFTDSVIDNIRYGKLDATEEEVYQAAKLANADEFIRLLPNGYQTQLTDNAEQLSQGQKQLLAIARAAIANAPVLILDEATSAIDTRTEALIQDGMDKLMKGRTVFVIAHRLSTIRNADKIVVLERGEIIEEGTHEVLIKKRGTYYRLYTGRLELS